MCYGRFPKVCVCFLLGGGGGRGVGGAPHSEITLYWSLHSAPHSMQLPYPASPKLYRPLGRHLGYLIFSLMAFIGDPI